MIPTAPSEQGPVLEWYLPSRLHSLAGALFVLALLAAGISGETQTLDWMRYPWLSGPVAATSLALFWWSNTWTTAGAEWLRHGRRWVATYRLVSVCLDESKLELIDSSDRRVRVYLEELQSNRRLWDLVYNGILHSARNRDMRINRAADHALVMPTHRHIVDSERGQSRARVEKRPKHRRKG